MIVTTIMMMKKITGRPYYLIYGQPLTIPVKLPGLQGASSSCVPGGQGARGEVVVLPGAQHVPGHVTGHGGHNGEGHCHCAFKGDFIVILPIVLHCNQPR